MRGTRPRTNSRPQHLDLPSMPVQQLLIRFPGPLLAPLDQRSQVSSNFAPAGPRGRDHNGTLTRCRWQLSVVWDEPEHESWYSTRSGGREYTTRRKARKVGLVSTIFRALLPGGKDVGTTGRGGMDNLGQICRKCGREVTNYQIKKFLHETTLLTADTR